LLLTRIAPETIFEQFKLFDQEIKHEDYSKLCGALAYPESVFAQQYNLLQIDIRLFVLNAIDQLLQAKYLGMHDLSSQISYEMAE